jgi:hypothetical protein
METIIEILKSIDYIDRKTFDSSYNTYTDKETSHNYISLFYEEKFKNFRDKKLKFLEIRTCGGSSSLLWKKAFSKSKIHTVDFTDYCIDEYRDNDIIYHVKDAYDESFIKTLGNFDIMIDDGSHTLDSQLVFIDKYYPKLNKGGIMIIEDIERCNVIPLFNKCYDMKLAFTFHNFNKCENSQILEINK